jgi:hypothetical protein
MVDSLPPSGIDPDNQTIITNSKGKLSVPLDGLTLDVGSSGKVQVFESTVYLAESIGFNVDESELPKSESVTADLTDMPKLTFRVDLDDLQVKIKVNGVELASTHPTGSFQTLEISGLEDYDFGTNSTITIEAYDVYGTGPGSFSLDYIQGLNQPKSRKVKLLDSGGLE